MARRDTIRLSVGAATLCVYLLVIALGTAVAYERARGAGDIRKSVREDRRPYEATVYGSPRGRFSARGGPFPQFPLRECLPSMASRCLLSPSSICFLPPMVFS
jgi:hypothetical protein